MDPYIGIFIHNNTKLLFIIWLEKFTFSKPKKNLKLLLTLLTLETNRKSLLKMS